MTDEYLTAPGLLVHVFLAADGPDAAAGWERLRSLWHVVTCQFGLDRPIPSLDVPTRLPPENVLPADGVGLLTAAECGEASVWQASVRAEHDVLCLTLMMAPPRDRDCARAWTDLEHAWREVVADLPPEGVLGETRIFLALVSHRSSDGPAPDDAAIRRALDLVRAAVPEPSNVGWWQHWDAVRLDSRGDGSDEVLVWEAGPEARNARTVRRLAAVAPSQSERRVDQFLWTTGDGAPTPLARHVTHAARLRYQIRVFDDGKPSRRLRDELSLLADDLAGEPADGPDASQDSTDRSRLSTKLEHALGAAATLRTRLDAMRHAVGVIDENMRLALNLPETDTAVGPLSDDRNLAVWFGQRLDDEITRLDAGIRNARSAWSFLAGATPVSARPPDRARAISRTPASLEESPSRRGTSSREPRVVVFTALEVEYQAIREYLTGPLRQQAERGTLYEVGALPGARGSWRVAVTQTGPGSTPAGVQLERAVSVFEPEIVLFLGVAGGRKDVARGDVVVADTIYDYEWGKSTLEGYQPRMRTHHPAYRLLQRARFVARENRWQQRIRPTSPSPAPASFVKPIVTGGKVIAHDQSAVARLLDQYTSDALAVETEGHGFLEAAYMNPEVDALVIRGISDLLAGKDKASDDYWQPIASRHAAAFAVELLDSIGTSQP